MRKKNITIPVNSMPDMFASGIALGRASFKDLDAFEEITRTHRDDYHVFFLQETGTASIEVDFQEYTLMPSSVGYIHPHQVHRMVMFNNATFSALMINTESLNPEYQKVLEDITPAKPLPLDGEIFSVISDAISLCIKLSERKHEKLYQALLKDSCNTLVGLITSQYCGRSVSPAGFSRFEAITRSFRALLERDFIFTKQPAAYARSLNITTPYLNECVKNTTGHPVSYHIRQRVILEAKRLLYHSQRSVKEIASELGYDDYPYFSRLFTKVTGMTALSFRNKNRD